MPELPDITVYIEALNERISGRVLESLTIAQPNLFRTADPPVSAAEGRRVVDIRRLA